MSSRLVLGALFVSALGLAACDSHGGDVTPNNPLNPTPPPSGAPTSSPTTKPSAMPTASPSIKPTPTPTTGPSATPVPTPTGAVCAAPPPDPNTSTIPLAGGMQAVPVPCFKDFTSTATIPAGTVANGASLQLAATTDSGAFGIPNDPTAGTRLITTSIAVTATITLGNSNIPTTVTSPSMINVGHTYEVENFLGFGGGPPNKTSTTTGLAPSGHTISFNVVDPAGMGFPMGATAFVVVYQN